MNAGTGSLGAAGAAVRRTIAFAVCGAVSRDVAAEGDGGGLSMFGGAAGVFPARFGGTGGTVGEVSTTGGSVLPAD